MVIFEFKRYQWRIGQNEQWFLGVQVYEQYGTMGKRERNRGNGLAR
jgi:hypothetical protein